MPVVASLGLTASAGLRAVSHALARACATANCGCTKRMVLEASARVMVGKRVGAASRRGCARSHIDGPEERGLRAASLMTTANAAGVPT